MWIVKCGLGIKSVLSENVRKYLFLVLNYTGEAKLSLHKKHLAVIAEQKEIEMSRMEHLKKLGVDLTAYLVAQQKNPDKHFRFDTTSIPIEDPSKIGVENHPQTPIQVHLHE